MVSEDVAALVARIDALTAKVKAQEDAAVAAVVAQRNVDVQAVADAVARAEAPPAS